MMGSPSRNAPHDQLRVIPAAAMVDRRGSNVHFDLEGSCDPD